MARSRVRISISRACGCDLSRGAHQCRDVREFARRVKGRCLQHDGVRPHAGVHGTRIRRDGLSDGDMAGKCDARRRKAQEELYAAIKRDGGTHNMLSRMQTRKELYATIGYSDYEKLDASIVKACRLKGKHVERAYWAYTYFPSSKHT